MAFLVEKGSENNEYSWEQIADYWYTAGWIRGVDIAFARFVDSHRENSKNQNNDIVPLLAALVSYQTGRGHVCLVLSELSTDPASCLNFPAYSIDDRLVENPHFSPQIVFAHLTAEQLYEALKNSSCVDTIGQASESAQSRPLVLKHGLLYLRRYWQYEARISQHLQQRMQSVYSDDEQITQTKELLHQLFPPSADTQINWQKLACALAARSAFTVITGGPGTGKTFTVVRLLALLQRLSSSSLRIRLAAPTGKAAARLKESVQSELTKMTENESLHDWQVVFASLSGDSSTLHRLLGVQPRTRRFRHHAANHLVLDVLIIDEASMIDIEMMDAVLEALPPHAQLILLGDKDQLASVEAGAVLGQLCHQAEQGNYRPPVWEYLRQVSDESLPEYLCNPNGPQYLQHVMMLKESRRFNAASGIGQLAQAVNSGNAAHLASILHPESPFSEIYSDVSLLAAGDNHTDLVPLLQSLKALCQRELGPYLKAVDTILPADTGTEELNGWARHVLELRNKFQILSPVRNGVLGVEDINQRVFSWLKEKFLQAGSATGQWYPGRPVMVTENDYTLNLRNGDIGVVLRSPTDNVLRVVFIDSDNAVRWILPSRLRQVETVFAMTVHKSQGSEFSHTVLVLPEKDNQVVSRELIYTGITRARDQLTLVAPDSSVLMKAVNRVTLRAGGLEL